MGRGRPTKLQNASAWLSAYLSGGKRTSKEIERVGASQGYGYRTLMRVKKDDDIRSIKVGHDWYWRRPDVAEPKQDQITLEDVIQKIESQGSAARMAAASSTAPPPLPTIDSGWTDEDFQKSGLQEIEDYQEELRSDLERFRAHHGKKSGLETLDHSEKTAELEREIARCDKWRKVKADEQGVF